MTGQRPVLVAVDDDRAVLDIVGRFARRAGFDVIACRGGREAIAQLHSSPADLALVDLRMPDVDGLDVLRAIRETDPHCQTILMTGHASIETAIEAIKLGARDYLSKPLDFARLEQLLVSVRDEADGRRALMCAEADVARRLEFCGMIGRAPAMQELFALIRRFAPHVKTALITGETGTGKELVSLALHSLGGGGGPFVRVTCSAAMETVFESELLGHVRGAFPGAVNDKAGLFEHANGGTLLLDEIGDLPPAVQAKLVRVIESGEVSRLGSLESRQLDVRVLASTNRDLQAEVAAGRFRADLYYRLNVVELNVPALRDRREDIPYLTAAFVREMAERLRKPLTAVAPGAERILSARPWEGNVRELRNVIQRACILAEGEFITERELGNAVKTDAAADHGGDPELLTTVERDHIQRALARSNGNKKAAAKMLGLSRRALYRRLERLDLTATITRRPGAAATVSL